MPPLLVPNVGEAEMLRLLLVPDLKLKLYANDISPAASDSVGTYTQVVGGGYAAKTLTSANWGISSGDPAIALYNVAQDFNFTGPTTNTNVYGYYVTNDAGTILLWAERFPVPVPFVPVNGSLIRITPRFALSDAA